MDTKDIAIKEKVTSDNPNYLLQYLDLSNAPSQIFNITLKRGKETKVIPYELKQRDPKSSDRAGFNSSDVLYLIMPYCFASGDPSNDIVMDMIFNHCGSEHFLFRDKPAKDLLVLELN